MSTTAGVFSETVLNTIRAMADKRYLAGRTNLNFVAQVESLKIINQVQTANISELNARDKDYTLEIEWPNNCSIVTGDECEPCVVGGPELSTNAQKYKLENCIPAGFSVKGSSFIDNDFNTQDMIANGLLSADKVICEELNQRFLLWLSLVAGVANWNPGGEIGTPVGNQVQIATANFNIAAVGYMIKVLQYDRIDIRNNISGNELFNAYQNVSFTEGFIPDGIGTTGRVNTFPILFDLYNFNQAGLNDRIFSIANGAIALVNKSYYGPTPTDIDGLKSVYTIQSRFFPGLTLEVWVQKVCENDLISYNFNVKLRYEFILNPAGCDALNTGIIQFVRV